MRPCLSWSTPCRNPSRIAPRSPPLERSPRQREDPGAGCEVRFRASRSRGFTGGALTRRSSRGFWPAGPCRLRALNPVLTAAGYSRGVDNSGLARLECALRRLLIHPLPVSYTHLTLPTSDLV